MTEMPYKNKICWITGASSGIGEALSYELARQGAILVLSARDKAKLQNVAQTCSNLGGQQVLVMAVDIAEEQEIDQAVATFLKTFDRLDLLVNNAGMSQRSVSIATQYEVEKRLMQVNFFGTLYLTKQILPILIRQKSGQLAVTSSIAGKFGFPLRTTYSASKHALQGYFESLRTELLPYGIGISIIIPGRVRTQISKHAIDGNGRPTQLMDKALEKGISTERAAKKIVKGLARDKKEILVGGNELLLVYIRRFVPWLYYRMVPKISAT